MYLSIYPSLYVATYVCMYIFMYIYTYVLVIFTPIHINNKPLDRRIILLQSLQRDIHVGSMRCTSNAISG